MAVQDKKKTQPPLAGQLMVLQEYMRHQGISQVVRRDRMVAGDYFHVMTTDGDSGRKIRLELERNSTAKEFLNEELRLQQSKLSEALWKIKKLGDKIALNNSNIQAYSNMLGDKLEQVKHAEAVKQLEGENAKAKASLGAQTELKNEAETRINEIEVELKEKTSDPQVWEYDLHLPGLEITL